MNLILVTSIFSFIIMALTFWFIPYVTPKSIQFGVRIPRDYERDSAISEIRRSYHVLILGGSVAIILAMILLPSLSGFYAVTLLSMPAQIVFYYLIYFRSFRKLHSIKIERNWYQNRTVASGAVYNVEEGPSKHVPAFIFILPAVVILFLTIYVGVNVYPSLPSMIPTHFGANGVPDQYSPKSIGTVFLIAFIQAGMTIGMFLLGYVISRTRQEIDVSRPTTSFEQQERFKWYTRDSLYLFTAAINLTMMSSSFNEWQLLSSHLILLFTLLPTLMGTGVLIAVLMSLGQMGSRINVPGSKTENTGMTNKSDDKDWKGGVVYYDKANPSVLVGKRFGIGWTFNFAKPISWIVLILLILFPVILFFVIQLLHH